MQSAACRNFFLVPALPQVPLEPFDVASAAIKNMGPLAKRMAFARVDHHFHRSAMILEGAKELIALADRDDRVLCSVHNQGCGCHQSDRMDWRALIIQAARRVWIG